MENVCVTIYKLNLSVSSFLKSLPILFGLLRIVPKSAVCNLCSQELNVFNATDSKWEINQKRSEMLLLNHVKLFI